MSSDEDSLESEDLHDSSSDDDFEEMYCRPEPEIDEDFPPSEKGYLIQITLDLPKMKPQVKRILRVPADTDFLKLSRIINIVFDWTGEHLWYFEVNELPHPSWSQQRAKAAQRYTTDMDALLKVLPKITRYDVQSELQPNRLRQANKLTLKDFGEMILNNMLCVVVMSRTYTTWVTIGHTKSRFWGIQRMS